jgi:cell division protein ZapA
LIEESEKTSVTVEIAGEQHTIRTQASPEHARKCAAHVDRKLSEIMQKGALVQPHKDAILAALGLADELIQARDELDALRTELTRRSDALAAHIDDRLMGGDLAGRL